MKKVLNTILYILFIVFYSISCLTVSSDKFSGYFAYHSTKFLFGKLILLFAVMLAITALNRKNASKILNYHTVYINIVLVALIIDTLFTHLSGSLLYFRVWWLAAIFITEAAVYLGAIIGKFNDFYLFSKKFWRSLAPTYIFTFLLLFARTPADNLTTNFTLGQGTFRLLKFIIENKGNADSEVFYIVAGNVLFFIPIAFLIKALIPSIKYYKILIIGIILPFIVEGYQYIFKCGDVDIDDIVFNIFGFLTGLILCIIEDKYNKAEKKRLSQ